MKRPEGPVILGITHPTNLNSAACLLAGGELVAMAEEERLNRLKHSQGNPANLAIAYCLKAGGITLDDVDAIAIGNDHNVRDYGLGRLTMAKNFYMQRALMDQLVFSRSDRRIRYVNHHLAHALSAYDLSGFDAANVITLDGTGGGEAGFLAIARGNDFEIVHRIPNTSSWGHFYTLVTEIVGFAPHSAEGKTMGLAAFGTPDPHLFDSFIDWQGEIPVIDKPRRRKFLARYTPRRPDEPLTQEHKDLAASLQHALERAGFMMSEFLYKRSGIRNLAMGGGCALNCSMNGKLRRLPHVDHIFVQPAAHDASTALGAAAKVHRELTGERPRTRLEHAYWGPEYNDAATEQAIRYARYPKWRRSSDAPREAAQMLADGKILGWVQGRMEMGPRALGGRSILADPRRAEMKDAVNKQVKGREPWRPFAPSFLEEDAADYVTSPYPSPFMIVAFDSKPENRDRIQAAAHVDGTVRVQTVSRRHNPMYWSLLSEFKKLSGVGALLNTSFNVAGEPIVCSPRDALRTFFCCGMDALVIGNHIVEK